MPTPEGWRAIPALLAAAEERTAAAFRAWAKRRDQIAFIAAEKGPFGLSDEEKLKYAKLKTYGEKIQTYEAGATRQAPKDASKEAPKAKSAYEQQQEYLRWLSAHPNASHADYSLYRTKVALEAKGASAAEVRKATNNLEEAIVRGAEAAGGNRRARDVALLVGGAFMYACPGVPRALCPS